MDANKILSADVLDIVFEGRNKAYGAYDLRKTYRQRLGRSMLIMCCVLLLLVGANFLSGFIKPDKAPMIIGETLILTKVEPKAPEKKEPIAVPRSMMKQAAAAPKPRTIVLTPPVIEKNPPPESRPPEMAQTENARIGTTAVQGDGSDANIVGPSPGGVDGGKGLADVPSKGDDAPFTVVEIESTYPGGPKAWTRFLERNLFNNLPQDAVDEGVQGTVTIRFVVDVDGSVSDITIISGPKEYQQAAVNAIRKSGKWTPAIQNGRKVKSYKMQAITVKLQE